MLQRKLAGRGIITTENAIARKAGVNKKCEINLSSKLEEVDFAFFYGASAPDGISIYTVYSRPASDNASHARERLLWEH